MFCMLISNIKSYLVFISVVQPTPQPGEGVGTSGSQLMSDEGEHGGVI